MIQTTKTVKVSLNSTTNQTNQHEYKEGTLDKVDNFLVRCREDKEREFALEKRQKEERARRRTDAKLSS